MGTLSQRTEGSFDILIGGMLSVFFGLMAVTVAIGLGWEAAAALGVGMLLMAWKVPLSPAARILRAVVAGWGFVALFGAVFAFLT